MKKLSPRPHHQSTLKFHHKHKLNKPGFQCKTELCDTIRNTREAPGQQNYKALRVIPLYRLIYPWYYADSNLNINNIHTFFME